jgi:glucokinase
VTDVWLGLDIGGTKTLAVAVSPDGREVVARRVADTPTDHGPDAVCESAFALGAELRREVDGVAGVGVGFAGLVDHVTGVVDSSVILPGWEGYPLLDRARRGFDLPCAIDNDATAAGFGEWIAIGAPADLNMILLTIGTGIGGAIMIDGAVYRGRSNTSAEFGNTTIDWQGAECVSGNRGSLNTLASGTALRRRAEELAAETQSSLGRNGEAITGEAIARAAASGDAVAVQAIDEAARALGAGVSNFVNIFNPDRVVLTGGVCNLGEPYFSTVVAESRARAFGVNSTHAEIVLSVHGDLACAHGAACLARAASEVRG